MPCSGGHFLSFGPCGLEVLVCFDPTLWMGKPKHEEFSHVHISLQLKTVWHLPHWAPDKDTNSSGRPKAGLAIDFTCGWLWVLEPTPKPLLPSSVSPGTLPSSWWMGALKTHRLRKLRRPRKPELQDPWAPPPVKAVMLGGGGDDSALKLCREPREAAFVSHH